MHIILVSDRMATARTLTVTARHVVLALAGLALTVLAVSLLFSYVTVRHAAEVRLPFLQSLLVNVREQETRKTQDFLRENINAMAVRVGQLQAQLIRLDTLGERLGQLSGLQPPSTKTLDASGQGGPLIGPTKPLDASGQGGPLIGPAKPLTAADLQRQIDQLSRQLESKGDYLGLIESELMDERVKRNQLPTALPVAAQWNASGFGWRVDPFTGEQAMHEGIDFIAPSGTPIVAAAAGIVVTAQRHAAYGNMVEVDHGNDLVTRYAHASRLLVREGALVKRGQAIAEVGSTGRSTGPHLHFEVRYKGAAQNPNRFLKNARQQKLAANRRR
ncbi:MAG: M23 family metallopeptidase [Rhodocyclaceae bacterium]